MQNEDVEEMLKKKEAEARRKNAPLYVLPPEKPEFGKGALLKRHLSSFPQKSQDDQELPLGLKVFLYQMHQ